MSLDDFRLVVDVHLMGAVICTKAVWEIMREQRHGRIVMTTSSSGLYGNFGQANYGAAKMALVGLMQTLAHRGREIRHPRQLPGAHGGHADDPRRAVRRPASSCSIPRWSAPRCWRWSATTRPRAPSCAPAPAISRAPTSR